MMQTPEAYKAMTAFNVLRSRLAAATEAYQKTGVAFCTRELAQSFSLLPDRTPRNYFKALAKQLGRPLVYAYITKPRFSWRAKGGDGNWSTDIELSIPTSERCKGLVSGLTLLAVPKREWKESDAVSHDHTPRAWNFRFYGEAGRAIFDGFVETCHTNPIQRVILNL